ncbi:MAG: peptidyl-prolyl cis-trans isomerase [Lachnospiraceae bacterium]
MKFKKVTALLLAGVMAAASLVGCGDKSASGNDAYSVIGTIDGKEISYDLANFMAKYQQASYDTNYLESFGKDMWSQDLYGNGTTLESNVKDSALESLKMLLVLEKNMETYKVTFDSKDKEAVKKAAEEFMKNNDKKAIKQIGASEKTLEEYLRLVTISNRVNRVIKTEVNKDVSDEEAAQRTISYVTFSKGGKTDQEGKKVEPTPEETAAAKEKAEAFAEAAKTDFEKACKDGTYTAAPFSYGVDAAKSGEMDAAVIAAADKLKEGELSEVVETTDMFYVLKLDSEFDQKATDEKKKEIVSKRENDHFQQELKKMQEKITFKIDEEAWATVTFDKLFKIVTDKKTEKKKK